MKYMQSVHLIKVFTIHMFHQGEFGCVLNNDQQFLMFIVYRISILTDGMDISHSSD